MVKFLLYTMAAIAVLANSVIAPAMGEIYYFFHTVDPTLVKMIMTTPALFTILCAFLANPLVRYFGKKNTILIGLCIYIIGGAGGGLVSDIYLILFFRAVLGVSLGILIPVAQSLPSDIYADIYERNQVIARQSASISAGNIIMVILSGFVATFSWRYSFYIYGLAIPILILALLYLPVIKTKIQEVEEKTEEKEKIENKFPLSVYISALSLFCLFAAVNAFYVNVAILIEERNVGNARLASYVLATGSSASFILAMNIQKVQKFLGDKIITIVCFTTGTAFLLLNFSYSPFSFFIVAILSSMSVGCMIPTTIMHVSSAVKPYQTVKALALLNSSMYMGQFLAPIVFDVLPRLPQADPIGGGALTLSFMLITTGILLTLFYLLKSKK